jgi:hypothetical protein
MTASNTSSLLAWRITAKGPPTKIGETCQTFAKDNTTLPLAGEDLESSLGLLGEIPY